MFGQKETVSYSKLNVTILRAKIKSQHLFFKSDCYVTLSLPTASKRTMCTKTIWGNNNFEWNETFTFRVLSQLKNILEINLFDKNTIGGDGLISRVYCDITKLSGKKETKKLPLEPETTGELVVEFELLPSEEIPCDYDTNGILMGGPFSALHIKVDKSPSFDLLKGKVLKIKGAHPENQTIHSEDQNLIFHINRDLETELELAPSAESVPVASTKLSPPQAQHRQKISLVVDGETVDFSLETHEGTEKQFIARISYDIPTQEKEYLQKRKPVVAQAVEKLLGLNTQLKPNKVPTVAVVASGGGSRAMTSLFGSLKGLKELGVLDAVTYISGVSGSTWAMSTLYQEANWSQQDINTFISAVQEHLDRSAWSLIFSLKELEYYYEELTQKAKDGYSLSADDLFGLICEQLVFQTKLESTLSDQQKTVNEGQNPFPIYNAVNIKDHTGCETEAEWCEFTPYEVGLQKYGAFIPSKDIGSQFLLGREMKKLPELRLPYLIGIWSSFFSKTISEFLHDVAQNQDRLRAIMEEHESIPGDDSENTLQTTHLSIASLCSSLTELLKDRPLISEMHNFVQDFSLRSNYDESSYFQAHKGEERKRDHKSDPCPCLCSENHPDAFPNELTPSDTTLRMVDSGLAINIGCPPILRPERDVDVIISLNYSWEPQNILKVLKKTAQYCKDHNIPFPNADFDSLENEPKKEVYIFEDKDNPKAPIVIHFPLVNVTYRDYKSPGVKRVTEEEIEAGKVDVESHDCPYTTSHLCYSKKNFDALVDLTAYNILNNRESICEVLQKALKRRESKIEK